MRFALVTAGRQTAAKAERAPPGSPALAVVHAEVGMTRRVYGTHVTIADSHVGHIDVIWSTEQAARKYALKRSTHPGVLYAAVTVFTLDELGTRYPLVWYVHGKENVNDRPFPTGLHVPVMSRHEPHNPH